MSDELRGNGFRRWLDKALVAAIAVIAAMIASIYGITRAEISRLSSEVQAMAPQRLDGYQRLARVEAEVQALKEMLAEMKIDIRYIKEKTR